MTPQPVLCANDIELLRIVVGRFDRVAKASQPECSQDDLRGCSPDLRELVDRDFKAAWRSVRPSSEPLIISAERFSGSPSDVKLAYSAGAIDVAASKNVKVGEYLTSTTLGSPDPIFRCSADSANWVDTEQIAVVSAIYCNSKLDDDMFKRHNFPFHEFVESTAIVWEGRPISRQRVVQYIANARGGNHYDPSRNRRKTGEDFVALDAVAGCGSVMDRDPVFYSFMSIAQDICKSESMKAAVEIMRVEAAKYPSLR